MRSMFCVVMCLAAGGAAAQTLYKCTGADGKHAFSDRPCVATNAEAKQEVKGAPTALETARALGISEHSINSLRQQCNVGGDLFACQALDDLRAGLAPEVSDAELARRWNTSAYHIVALRRACEQGNEFVCLRMERMRRSNAEQEKKDRQVLLTRMCHNGVRNACAAADAPNRAAQEQRQRAVDREAELCQRGDQQACNRMVDNLRKK
jgi:hypothetical protein